MAIRPCLEARDVSGKVFNVVEKLAKKSGNGKVAGTFSDAAAKLQGLISTETDNHAMFENGKAIAKDVWHQLRSQAGESGKFSGIRETMERIMNRLKEVLKTLQAEKMEADRKQAKAEADADAAHDDAYEKVIRAGGTKDQAAAAAAAVREMSGHVTFTTTPDGKLHRSDSTDSENADQISKLAKEGAGVWADVRADAQVQQLLKEEIAPGFEALIRSAVEVVCELISTLELPRVDGIYDSPLGSVCYHVDNLAFSEFTVEKDGLKVENQTGENGEQAGFGSTVSIEGIRTVMDDIHFAYCEFPKNWGVVDSEGLCTVKVDGARVGISYDIIVNTQELMRLVNHGVELTKNEEKLSVVKDKVQTKWANRGKGTEGKANGDADAKVPGRVHAAAEAALDKAFGSFGIATEEDDAEDEGYGGNGGESEEMDGLNDVQRERLDRYQALLRDVLGEEFVVNQPVMELRVHATSIAVGQLDVEIGGTSAAWLYNMIALVLTQQLRGTIEERINNLTVKQLAKLSGSVEAFSAGLMKIVVVTDQDEEEEEPVQQSMLGSWVSGGGLGQLRRDCGVWGEGWRCSHWKEGARIKRTPSSAVEIVGADGVKRPEEAPAGVAGVDELD